MLPHPGRRGLPPPGYRTYLWTRGLSHARLTADDWVSEGDKVAVRFRVDATHQAEFMGTPATGKRVSLTGVTILALAGGQCVERWSESDFLGLLQQIGAMPTPA